MSALASRTEGLECKPKDIKGPGPFFVLTPSPVTSAGLSTHPRLQILGIHSKGNIDDVITNGT